MNQDEQRKVEEKAGKDAQAKRDADAKKHAEAVEHAKAEIKAENDKRQRAHEEAVLEANAQAKVKEAQLSIESNEKALRMMAEELRHTGLYGEPMSDVGNALDKAVSAAVEKYNKPVKEQPSKGAQDQAAANRARDAHARDVANLQDSKTQAKK